MTTSDQLTAFIEKTLLTNPKPIGPSTSLFKESVLSSLDLVSLLDFIEKEFHVSVPPEDVDPENFDTVAGIAAYLDKKQK